jgi:anti-sigma regulatory factor (Ser/Thr protein kinase)
MPKSFKINDQSDVYSSRRKAKEMAFSAGFDDNSSEEISLVVSELGSNIIKHAGKGMLYIKILSDPKGIMIESKDNGPIIENFEQKIGDGISTSDSLGYGLGTVNRLMDEIEYKRDSDQAGSNLIICKIWLRENHISNPINSCPFDFGVATRACGNSSLNGDSFVIKKWDESALIAIIDGLGHGQFAHRASQKSREYIEDHYDQPLEDIFRGVDRSCRATRGVVMTIVRFDWLKEKMKIANIGNIAVRVFENSFPMKIVYRRGIIGRNAPKPIVTEHDWQTSSIMILHTDGITSHWGFEDISQSLNKTAMDLAQNLLSKHAKDNDDATVLVVKGKANFILDKNG